jgi:MtN3 and saliva related transmembrane protein
MAETVLAAAAATWGVVMGLSPVLQIRRMLAERSSRDVSVGYFVVLLVGFGLWIAYGAVAGVPALVLPNAVAVCVTVATIVVALRLRRAPRAPEDPAAQSSVAVRSRR